jgi:hypothetical protein
MLRVYSGFLFSIKTLAGLTKTPGENVEFAKTNPDSPAGYPGKKQKMETQNAETDLEEITHERPIGDLIWLYAQSESNDHFYSLLKRLIGTEQFTPAIELLKLRTLNRIHGDLDTIAVKGIGTHVAKLANALDHMDDYGIGKRLDE